MTNKLEKAALAVEAADVKYHAACATREAAVRDAVVKYYAAGEFAREVDALASAASAALDAARAKYYAALKAARDGGVK